jgi:hypothetical protein
MGGIDYGLSIQNVRRTIKSIIKMHFINKKPYKNYIIKIKLYKIKSLLKFLLNFNNNTLYNKS